MGEQLDLRERGLSAVPHEVWEARGLRSLALARNPLGAVPDAVGSLTSLTALLRVLDGPTTGCARCPPPWRGRGRSTSSTWATTAVV